MYGPSEIQVRIRAPEKDARKDASARRGEQPYSVRKAAVDWDDGETRASTPNKKTRTIREDLSGFTATPRNVIVS